MLSNIRKSLSKMILIVLTASVALVMIAAICVTYSLETEDMLKTMDINSRETLRSNSSLQQDTAWQIRIKEF